MLNSGPESQVMAFLEQPPLEMVERMERVAAYIVVAVAKLLGAILVTSGALRRPYSDNQSVIVMYSMGGVIIALSTIALILLVRNDCCEEQPNQSRMFRQQEDQKTALLVGNEAVDDPEQDTQQRGICSLPCF